MKLLDELRLPVRAVRERVPAVFAAYGELNKAVFTDGALDAKTKELALAIAVSNAALRELTPT
jgi:alkylhydroperoxidase/carboxymuconolactone decarboxylase family protein YurZ